MFQKNGWVIILGVFVLTGCQAQEKTVYSFSGVRWQDSRDKVKNKMRELNFKIDAEKDNRGDSEWQEYEGTVSGSSADVFVHFDPNQRPDQLHVYIEGTITPSSTETGETSEYISKSVDENCKSSFNQLTEKYGTAKILRDDKAIPDFIDTMRSSEKEFLDLFEAQWKSDDESLDIACTLKKEYGFSFKTDIIYKKQRKDGSL